MCLQKHLMWASPHYFILQKSQLPFVPFVNPALKLCIYCESSGEPPPPPPLPPLIVRLNWGPKGQTKFLGDPLPPSYLRIWMTGPLPYLKVWIHHWSPCFLDSKIQIWIFLAKKCTLRFNPLNPNSDQQQSSPNNVNTWLRRKVMRIINKMISLGKLLWSSNEFSHLILWGNVQNVWMSVQGICMVIATF